MLTFVIPCKNEEVTIRGTIENIQSSNVGEKQIIVIDNNSDDKTASVASSLGVEVYHEPVLGKGFAFRKALNYVNQKSDVIVLIDGDNTYSLRDINQSIALIREDGFDMVIGNRVVPSSSTGQFRPGHKFGNFALSFLFRRLFGMDIWDSLSGYRVMSRGFALSFLHGASKFELETELNVHAYHLESPVVNQNIEYRSRPSGSNSKLRTYSDGMKILTRNLSLWTSERPLFAFAMAAIPTSIMSGLLFVRAMFPWLETGDVNNFPSLIVAIGLMLLSVLFVASGLTLNKSNIVRRSFTRYVYRQVQTLN